MPSSKKPTPKPPGDYVRSIYLNHYRGAWVTSVTSLFMWIIAIGAYLFQIIRPNNLIGVSAAVAFLYLINPPFLLVLKHSRSLRLSNVVSLFVNFLEIVDYTAVIYFLGGINALWMSPIYAVLIYYIGMVGPRILPFVIATFCWAVLAAAVALEYFGIIPCQYPVEYPRLPGGYQISVIITVAAILYVVAFVSAYMANVLRERKNKLKQANLELEQNSVKLKQAEKELRTSYDELEKRVEERTAELAQTNENLRQEVADRARAEVALKESEERYRALFEDNPIETFVVDKDARITMYNGAKRTSGGTLPRLGDVMYRDYAAGYSMDMHQRLMECIAEKKSRDFRDQRYNDRYLDIRMSPMEGGAIITVIDQTEKRKLENRLHRAQKMEAMGLMAGGIAHDLNNILSGIVSYPELILMDLAGDSPLRKPLETIQESGIRAAEVVADLLTITRGVAGHREVFNLNAAVEEYLDSAEHSRLSRNQRTTTFKTQLDADVLNINGSLTHMKKALMNLAANASEAIEGAGTVTIATTNRYLDKPLKGYEEVNTGEYALLSVSDDGTGISPEDLERIFEPFYTKKVMGRTGTGLGLAVVWNTVQDHNGYINVTSSKKGTLFELYFPVTREVAISEKEEVHLEDYMGNGERILVVDDEERQREIACGLLIRLGYSSEAVSGGKEAVEYVKEQPVDLIVLDMVMPRGLNGRETYEEIIKICPGQKAIIASGFAKTEEVEKAQSLGAGRYIKKPYTLQNLAAAVKEELAKNAGRTKSFERRCL
ncbi:MAG: Histidine kinase [Thermodesulfobacteriota bacterium]|nr:Histidine kinase [Thermodesulfobacteriota bacterium]